MQVARALNQNAPTLHTVERGYGWTPEQMFLREFNWRLTQEELEGGLEIYDRTVRVVCSRGVTLVSFFVVFPLSVVACETLTVTVAMLFGANSVARKRLLIFLS